MEINWNIQTRLQRLANDRFDGKIKCLF